MQRSDAPAAEAVAGEQWCGKTERWEEDPPWLLPPSRPQVLLSCCLYWLGISLSVTLILNFLNLLIQLMFNKQQRVKFCSVRPPNNLLLLLCELNQGTFTNLTKMPSPLYHLHYISICKCFTCSQNGAIGNRSLAQSVKNPPAMQETWVQSWVGKILWRRKWQPTPIFLPGKFYGEESLAGMGSQGSDMTEQLNHHQIDLPSCWEQPKAEQNIR